MKFIHYLESISGVDTYALTSFLIFFTFFILMSIWAFKADKKMIDEISNIPLNR
jgi:cbb3-type cytochrome oxidase subunit 3